MTQLQRELLRLYVQAEGVIAEHLDPNDTLTTYQVLERISTARVLLREEFFRQVVTDTVVTDLLWNEVTCPASD